MSYELNDREAQILVQVLDEKYRLEDFTVYYLYREHLFVDINVGGIADPVGQLINWLWGQIQGALSGVEQALKNFMTTIRDQITSSISGVIDALGSSLTSIINSVLSVVNSISASLSSLGTSIESWFNSVASSITDLASNLVGVTSVVTSIWDFLQGIGDIIVGAISDALAGFQSLIESLSSQVGEVISSVQSIASQIVSSFEQVVNIVASIPAQVSTALETFTSTLMNAITSSISTLQSWMSNALNSLSSAISQITSVVQGLASQIGGIISSAIGQLQTWISQAITNISTGIAQLATSFQTLGSTILNTLTSSFQTLQSWVSQAITPISMGITQLIGSLQTLGSTFMTAITDGFTTLKNWLWTWLQQAFSGIQMGISQLITGVTTLGSNLLNAITSGFQTLSDFIIKTVIPSIEKGFQDFLAGFGDYWSKVEAFFKERYNQLVTGVNEVKTTLQGFTNPLVNIYNWFKGLPDWWNRTVPPAYEKLMRTLWGEEWKPFFEKDLPKSWADVFNTSPLAITIPKPEDIVKTLLEFLKTVAYALDWLKDAILKGLKFVGGLILDALTAIWDFIKNAITWLGERTAEFVKWIVDTIFTSIWNWFKELASKVIELVGGGVDWILNTVKGFAEAIGKPITETIEGIMEPTYALIAPSIEEEMNKLVKRLAQGRGSPSQWLEIFTLIGTYHLALIGSQVGARGINLALHALATKFDTKEIAVKIGWKHKIRGTFRPLGVGLTGDIDPKQWTEVYARFNLGAFLRHLAGLSKEHADAFSFAMLYGASIWLSQPLMRLASSVFRDMLVLELPPVPTIISILRRHMATNYFNRIWEAGRSYLRLYGYRSEIIDWLTNKEKHVSIQDRFGTPRKFFISQMYDLPTPSDLCRMMVHDIILKVGQFAKAMKMRGYPEDVAYMYYLLHYRYPPLEKLWEFYCRAKAKMLWLSREVLPKAVTDEEREMITKARLGFMPKYPKELEANPQFILSAIRQYAKWWDYAFFAWIDGMTSDRLIQLEMMADIPMRIDARWMYKWMIIGDEELYRIVTARGMHPNWVEPITVAEAMNALMEERTYARTGIISSFKEGFMTARNVNEVLSKLTTVKILGKNWTVRFLEGEIKLLSLRAKYDRALDILRDFSRDLLRQSAENIITFLELTSQLKDLTSKIARGLEITLTFDESYWKLYEPVRGALFNIYTIHRIRIWIRYMLYRILTRFSEGYMSKADIRKLIDELVKGAKLTDTEKQIITDVSETMLEYFTRRTKAMGILRRLSRGVISTDQALNALTKLGLDKETAQALIDEHAKTYTITIATLMSYADLISIPEEVMKKKLDLMGVPEDEKDLILEVFRLKPIKTELGKVVRAVLDDFEDGYLTEEEAKNRLKALHQTEPAIKLLIEASKIERDAKVKKYKVDAILYKLRRAEISIEDAKRQLSQLIKVEELVNALIEKNVREPLEEVRREYTLSVSTLLSYASLVPVPEELLKKKMATLGIPEEEQKIILQVFKIRPIRDELATAVRKVLDSFEEGLIDENTCKQNLTKLMKRDVEIQLLIEASKIEKQIKVARAKIDTILYRLRRGAIKEDEARRQLQQLIKDKDMLEALIERNVRVYTFSPSTLVSMMERVPIPEDWLKEKLKVIGVTEEELKAYLAYAKTAEIEEELRSYMREVANDYVEGFLSDEEFKRELDNIATLWGNAPRVLGVDWVFLSPDERKLIFEAYKKRRERKARGRR